MALGMSNFDTIVFLTQFNKGFAMTIPELAKSFYVVDENRKGDGADEMATISCHAKNCPNPVRGCLMGTDITQCENPTFAINRYISAAPFSQSMTDSAFQAKHPPRYLRSDSRQAPKSYHTQ